VSDAWGGSFGVAWGISWSSIEELQKFGGSGKTKYHWEVEQERQEAEHEFHRELQESSRESVSAINPSLLSARVELEKARRELETRRRIEKEKGARKKKHGLFTDKQAEKAYSERLDNLIQEGFDEDEAIFLMEAIDG